MVLFTSVQVPFGDAGTYGVLDFVLMLLAHACDNRPFVRESLREFRHFAPELMALWARKTRPSQSQLSRWLARIDDAALDAWRRLFFHDLCSNGLSGPLLGGLFGADGSRTLVVAVDGTRQAVRHRAVPTDPSRPPWHRRSQDATAPGHGGRKRGEAFRTRLTVLQRHTSEWLGTFGDPGNGDAFARLDDVGRHVVAYLHAPQRPLREGVLRLDGEPGWPSRGLHGRHVRNELRGDGRAAHRAAHAPRGRRI